MFGDYADMFIQNVTRHLGAHTTRVDVAFDRYIVEDLFKAGQGEANSFASSSMDNMSHFHLFGANSLPWMRTRPILPGFYRMSS